MRGYRSNRSTPGASCENRIVDRKHQQRKEGACKDDHCMSALRVFALGLVVEREQHREQCETGQHSSDR